MTPLVVVVALALGALVVLGLLRPTRVAPVAAAGRPSASGGWLVAILVFLPAVVACAAAVAQPRPPLVSGRAEAAGLLGAACAGMLAFVGVGQLERPARGLRRALLVVGQAILGTVAVYTIAFGGWIVGRQLAGSPLPVFIPLSLAAVVACLGAAAGIPSRHPGIDVGMGTRSIVGLALFGVLGVPILSDPSDLIVTKVDGWPGIGVFLAVLVVLGGAVTDVDHLGEYLQTRRLPRRLRNPAVLVIRCAVWVVAGIALGAVLRR